MPLKYISLQMLTLVAKLSALTYFAQWRNSGYLVVNGELCIPERVYM